MESFKKDTDERLEEKAARELRGLARAKANGGADYAAFCQMRLDAIRAEQARRLTGGAK